jgi:predicted nucleic acid-binding protein
VIVADTNLIAYLYLPGKYSKAAEDVLLRDPDWAVPRLWRSELRNILSTYMRQDLLAFDDALSIFRRAESLLGGNEYDVSTSAVLRLAKDSGCSAYDCEFIALAQHLDAKLISADAKLCKAFPNCTMVLSEAQSG